MKKDILKRIIIVLIIIVFILFVMFLFFLRNQFLPKRGSNQSDVKIVYELDDFITVKNILPISDSIGKSYDGSVVQEGTQSLIDFSIVNSNSDLVVYDIYLTKNQISPREIKDNYVKVFLTDDRDPPLKGFDSNIIPVFSDLPYMSHKPSSKLLYSGVIEGNTTQYFRLRAWLSDSYSLSGLLETFQFDVGVVNQ